MRGGGGGIVGEEPSSSLPGWASALWPGSGTMGPTKAHPGCLPPSSSQLPSGDLGPPATAFLLLCFKDRAHPMPLGAHSWRHTTRDLPRSTSCPGKA